MLRRHAIDTRSSLSFGSFGTPYARASRVIRPIPRSDTAPSAAECRAIASRFLSSPTGDAGRVALSGIPCSLSSLIEPEPELRDDRYRVLR